MKMELNEAVNKLQNAGAKLLIREGGAYESFVPWLSVGYKKAVEEIKKFFEDGYEPEYMNGAIKEAFPQIFKMFEEGQRADELGKFLVQIYHDF